MNITTYDFDFTNKEQHEYTQFGDLPFELRKKVKHLMKTYQDGTLSDDDDVFTLIKDVPKDNRKMIHDYIVNCINFLDPEEELLDLCDVIDRTL